ncbi:DUF515 domain-containing protein [Methanobacterium aggregans]|uniref:DUF515 domain-containing protein n=1 Tax=Methanobacterium aggregans TaxID=1615586 RepID=UPI001AE9F078|nr:DUF515 domain-containing protein [Methanobacterium aggregans]MBP2045765.1 hypothetical protein [Methanobacterium aggregans]
MLDKILGKKDKDKKEAPDLRKNGKKSESDMGGRLKDMVGKVSGNNGKGKETGDLGEKSSNNKKIPKPMPRPKTKPLDSKPRLRPPEKKAKGLGGLGGGGGFGKKLPDDDQKTLVGAAVFGVILIVIAVVGYYFLFYAPYQDTLNDAKMQKYNEINSYFKGGLASDPKKQILLAEIDSGVTPDQVLAVDVLGPATTSWRTYQTQQINNKKDTYKRVMITYDTGNQSSDNQKDLMMKVDAAQQIVNSADASVLSNMDVETPDTVAVPILVSRLQAAGGLVTVGNTVDVYLRTNASSGGNTTNTSTTPNISGATVLAILRATDSGTIDANLTQAQLQAKYAASMAASASANTNSTSGSGSAYGSSAGSGSGYSKSVQVTNVEELLKAAASRTWNQGQVSSLLTSYGWRLADFERVSNLGELDAQYMILLEVPRDDAPFLIQNMDSAMLTVPTQSAPTWMISELKTIYN